NQDSSREASAIRPITLLNLSGRARKAVAAAAEGGSWGYRTPRRLRRTAHCHIIPQPVKPGATPEIRTCRAKARRYVRNQGRHTFAHLIDNVVALEYRWPSYSYPFAFVIGPVRRRDGRSCFIGNGSLLLIPAFFLQAGCFSPGGHQ